MSSTADPPSAGEGASDPRAATAKTVVALDADGDLILRAGTTSFKVCSATLRRASPVWKAMLFGPWKESRPTTEGQEWVVTQSEDSPSALKIVFAIVHDKFDRVPQHMDVTPFSEVLLVADKYNVSGVMGPWMKQWAKGIDWCEISQRRNHSLIRVAYIAWDLGLEDRLMMITRTLIVEALKPILEGLFGGTLFPGPPDFREIVMKRRKELIQAIVDFYKQERQSRIDHGPSGCRRKRHNNSDDKICDFAILGGIESYMARPAKALPENAADSSPKSAAVLMSELADMFSQLITLPGHDGCIPARRYALFKTGLEFDSKWVNILSEAQKEMAARREELGL